MAVAGFAALLDIDERADAERVEKIDRLAGIVIAVRARLIEFRVWIGPEVCESSRPTPKPTLRFESLVSSTVPLVFNTR